MQRQYRLIETLILAFVAAFAASYSALAVGITADNWKAVLPGALVLAIIAGGKAVFVAWADLQGPTAELLKMLTLTEPLGTPLPSPRLWRKPGQICPQSGQWTNTHTRKQATCVIGERMPPVSFPGSRWVLTDETRHVNA